MPQKRQNKFTREIPSNLEEKDWSGLGFQANGKNPDTSDTLIYHMRAALYLGRVLSPANSYIFHFVGTVR